MPILPLNQKLVDRAISAGVATEIGDVATKGLFLRVRSSGRWTWNYRRTVWRKDHRRDLGNEWTYKEAKALADELNAYAAGTDFPDDITVDARFLDWIAAKRKKLRGVPYTPPAPAPEPETGVLWRDAQAAWIADFRARRRETTTYNNDRALKLPEFEPLHDRRVSSVTRIDVAEVIGAIFQRGAERQAELCVNAVRQMFAWLGEDSRTRKYGVKPKVMEDLKAPERTEDEAADEEEEKSTHVPDGAEIGAILRWLREDHAPERDRLAAQLLLFTAQRRRAVACARQNDFVEIDGVQCWSIPPMHRKSASILKRKGRAVHPHVLPLPPAALAIVARARELAGDGEWLFPGMRPRRTGAEVSHLHPTLVTHLFKKIPGSKAKPHDVRRAFATTYKKFARISLSDVKIILDHSEDHDPDDVTVNHYSFDPQLPAKTPIIDGWAAWVAAQAKATP